MIPKRDIIYICEECGIEVEVKDFQGRKTPKFCKACIKERQMDSKRRQEEKKKQLVLSEKNKIISNVNQQAREAGISYGQWVARNKR